jgi:hypothetical protein
MRWITIPATKVATVPEFLDKDKGDSPLAFSSVGFRVIDYSTGSTLTGVPKSTAVPLA